MNERSEQLAGAFARSSADAIALVEGAPEDCWGVLCEGEGWTVAAVAHHIAIAMPLEIGVVQAIVNGEPVHPIYHDLSLLHSGNAQRSRTYAACSKTEVLDLLRANTEHALSVVRGLTDAQLDRSAMVPIIADQPITAGTVIERVLIGHIGSHLASIHAVVDSRAFASDD